MVKNELGLTRDWISFELAEKIQATVADHVNVSGGDKPYGVAFATQCLAIVSALANAPGIDDNQKIMIMSDIFAFMTDLFNNGWGRETKQ